MPSTSLSVGAFGDEVARLQGSLRKLGYTIPSSEADRKFFGAGTRQALQKFQRQNGLPVTGVVDAKTAAALAASPLQRSGGQTNVVAATVSGTAAPISQAAARAPDSKVYVVQGQVSLDDGTALGGVFVVAIDQDLRAEQVLGPPGKVTTTGQDGRYQIQYTSSQFAKAEKDTADLVVRVMNAAGAVMATSGSPLFNAPQIATINITVPATSAGLASEYDRLLAEVEPLIGNVVIVSIANPSTIDRLADLKSDDIDFLAGETGELRARIAALATSSFLQKQALSIDLMIPAAAFYGLARMRVPLDTAGLLTRSVDQLQTTLTKAVESNIVPTTLTPPLEQLAQRIHQFAVRLGLQKVPTPGTHSVAELLSLSGLSGEQQSTLLSLSINNAGSPQQFWTQLRSQPGFQTPGLIDKLQLTVQLGLLTLHHVPLVEQLQQMQIKSPRDLVKMDVAAWLGLINKQVKGKPIGVPPGSPGASPEEQALNYAAGMVKTLQAAFPTQAMAQIATVSTDLPAKDAVTTFFANAPDFDMRTSRVDAYVAQNAATVFKGIGTADRTLVVQQVKRLQRIFQLSTGSDSAAGLLGKNLDSAHKIAKIPEKTFIGQYSVALGGETTASLIYQRAQFINARTVMVYSNINDALNGAQPSVLGANAIQSKQRLLKVIPNYEELFGSLDLCECEDCRSVLSPAAYLVDLFQFLRYSWPNDNGQSPLDILFSRRPDLPYLPLTCENTNTAMPYIDLVNEVLEAYIVLSGSNKWSSYTGYDTGDTSSAVLESSPQQTNDAAYAILDQGVYPATLPFNQPVATSRVYLANLGTSRYEVLATFQRQSITINSRGTAAEYLAISREEFQIITKSDFDPSALIPARTLSEFYGYSSSPPPNWESDICKVPNFLTRTGVEYTDLIQIATTNFINPNYPQGDTLKTFLLIPVSFATLTALVKSNFVNPDPNVVATVTDALGSWQALIDWSNANYQALTRLIVLDAMDGSCNLDSTNLVHLDGTVLSDPELDRLHRFIRLWRKLGWSVADVDRAMTALSTTDITPDFIVQLAQVQQLQSELNIQDLQIVFSLWGLINTRGDGALYNKLFLTKATQDQAFLRAANGAVLPSSSTEKLDGHVPALLAALRVRASDLAAMRADAGLDAAALLTLANVSILYRYAALGQMLKSRVADLLALKTLSGINPFSGPAATLQFQALAGAVQRSGLKVAQLTYLYRHLSPPPADLSPLAAQVQALAQTLHKSLAQIAQDNVSAPDPTGELTRTKLMVLFDNATAEATVGMINGSALYSSPLTSLPSGVVFPDSVKQKVSYDATSQVLRFQGGMTTVEQSALAGAAPPNATAYQNAVSDLYQQPVTFIQDALSGFLDINQATGVLVRNVASLDQNLNAVSLDQSGNVTADPTKAVTTAIATKFSYLLSQLLPYLTTQQSHILVKQTIANTLGLNSAVAHVLLELILVSQVDPKEPAIVDFLALAEGGLTVSYFASPGLTGSPTSPMNPVDFSTGIPPGTQSARWKGMLQAPNNGIYTLFIQTNGTPQIWLDNVGQTLSQNPQTGEWGTAAISLTAGKLYDLRLEVISLPASNAWTTIRWKSATLPKVVVSAGNLYAGTQLHNLATTLTRTQKAALIVNTLSLNDDEVAYLSNNGKDFGGFDLNALPLVRDATNATTIDLDAPTLFQSWQRLNAYVTLRNGIPQGAVSLLDVFGAGNLNDAENSLVAATGWDPEAIATLVGPSGFDLATSDFSNEIALVRLQTCVALITRLGVSATQLFAWADLTSVFADLQTKIAPDIKKTVQGKYDPDTWLTVAKALSDKLRRSQRDALIAYLLPLLQLSDANQLLEFFLIDSEMGACMETSRIKQAISSTQFFIQRCLLNLESELDPATGKQLGVAPWAIDAKQWDSWRSRYSDLWAPAKEVFTYPENWLVSELRDDKSPFFKQFESALLQNEITNDNVEAAYLAYLQALDQVARLEICGMYWEDVDPSTGEIIATLHVFGRTRQDPKSYFYRRLANNVWTAWEPVTVDIQGDHLIPVVWNRRLMIFWPTFAKQADAPLGGNVDPSQPIPVNPPNQYLLVGLAWSEYKQGKWSPKSVSGQKQQLVAWDDSACADATKHDHYNYVFRTEIKKDVYGLPTDLLVYVFFCGPGLGYCLTFDIGGCTGDTVNIINIYPGIGFAWDSPVPTGASFDAMTYAENPGQEGLVMIGQDGKTPITFLNQTPSLYNMLYPHQGGFYTLQLPFFYQDGAVAPPNGGLGASPRVFFATPSIGLTVVGVANANAIDLSQYITTITTALNIPVPDTLASTVPFQSFALGENTRQLTVSRDVSVTNQQTIAEKIPNNVLLNSTSAISTAVAGSLTAINWTLVPNWISPVSLSWWIEQTTDLTFDNHYHPFVCEFMKALTRQGVPGLLAETTQTFGVPYTHTPWLLAFWQTGPQSWVTAIAENVSGPPTPETPWGATGCIIQGDFGLLPNLNFEAVVLQGGNLVHYWKDNSIFGIENPWQLATVNGLPDIITTKATGPGWLIQSDYDPNGTGHGRLDVVVQEGTKLVHYSRDNTSAISGWNLDPNIISSSVAGPGCITQSNRIVGGNGRLEVLGLEGSNLVHYWQDNAHPVWQRGEVITSNARSFGCIIQSDYFDSSDIAYLEVIVCQGYGSEPPYDLVHYTYANAQWSLDPYISPGSHNAAQVITSKATGAGSIVQSDIRDGRHANFEVIVPEGNNLVHYWRDNANRSLPWQQGQVVTPRATGPGCLIQSSFGRDGMYYGNFEVAALEGTRLVHYWISNSDRFFFSEQYRPNEQNVTDPFPVEDVDFRYGGAYSIYNWEIFFHAPLLIATKLCASQRFQDALVWLKYILNLTDDSLNEAPPARYWKFLPFKNVPQESVIDMMMKLDAGDPEVLAQLFDWSNHPFEPFRIARLRPSAFQKNVLMKCWDILIGWGDYLFQQNTIESINLAEQFYVLVADSQGPRPQPVPGRGKTAPMNYIQLKSKLDAFSNAIVEVENAFPFSGGVPASPSSERNGLLGMSDTLYFCVPPNAKLLGYWDTIADRLFKIRNCMNIQGVVEQLPLFEPILDPALLVQAAAQGIDLSSVLSDINSPLPYYRFGYALQKALEVCTECRSFGAALLSAVEKNDAEALALVRATQENQIQGLMQQIKSWEHDQATSQVAVLQKSRDTAVSRYLYYQALLTGTVPSPPPPGTLIQPLPTPMQKSLVTDGSQLLLEEQNELDSSHTARDRQVDASSSEILASVLGMLPNLEIATKPLGIGVSLKWGGGQLWNGITAIGQHAKSLSEQYTYDASHASKTAGHFRRQQEWTLQSNLASGEMMQIDQQIASANIRAAIAYYELNNVYPSQKQNTQAIQDFLTNKYTNQALYTWLITDLSATYFQCYQLAYDLAKKAERTFRFERGVIDSNFIQFGYWNSLQKGLQAGERLYLALKQMERAYQDQNKREYEISKRVSLVLLDPLAFVSLKEIGRCVVDLPESLFDADYYGHFMRRLKNVTLTIPCVTGPYTSVNCTLTLLKSKIRFDSNPQPSYPEQDNDPRFIYNFAATQSIATSTGQSDAGMFEVSFRDERYLPFEGAGAVSQWRIEVPPESNAFDFETITDVVINLSYTARDGGDPLRQAARNAPSQLPQDATRMFSLKHEFSSEWHRFLQPPDTAAAETIMFNLGIERFPYVYRGRTISINKVELFLILQEIYDGTTYKLDPKNPTPLGDYQKGKPLTLHLTPPASPVTDATLSADSLYGGVPHGVIDLSNQPGGLGPWQLQAGDADIQALSASLWTTVTTSGMPHYRLIEDTVSDIVAVCHYSVS